MSSDLDNQSIETEQWSALGLCRVCGDNACLPSSDFCADCEAEILGYQLLALRRPVSIDGIEEV